MAQTSVHEHQAAGVESAQLPFREALVLIWELKGARSWEAPRNLVAQTARYNGLGQVRRVGAYHDVLRG